MADLTMQVGDSFILPTHARLVVKERGTSTRYVMMIHEGFSKLDTALVGFNSVVPYRLFFFMVEQLKSMQGCEVTIDPIPLADQLNVSSSSVYRYLKYFCDRGLIRRVGKRRYRLNPEIVWSGKTIDRIEAVIEWDRNSSL